jgi:hypothetical protein
MRGKIKHIVQKLIVMNNVAQFLEQIVFDQTIDFNEMVMAIFNDIDEINSQEKSLHLSKFIAGYTINKKCLSGLENLVGLMVNDEPNAVRKQFMKKILIEISKKLYFIFYIKILFI